jgi:Leucine-rich repeat (LRR) protein
MKVQLNFEAPYFINRICNNHHKGSIAMNGKEEIFVRDVLELQKTSSKRTFCFKCSGDLLREGFGTKPENPGQWMVSHLMSFLTEIQVRNHHLPKIPAHLLTSQSIRVLNFNGVGLECIPESIGDLPLLTTLSLANNNLTSLSSTLRNLRRLNQLVLDNNPGLRSLNPISGHSSLKILMARVCSIERLPHDLPQLTDLHLSNNNLTDLDSIETLGFDNYKKKSFFLNYNQLSDLPGEVLDIPSLVDFRIEYNRFAPDTLLRIVKELRETYPRLKLTYEKQTV